MSHSTGTIDCFGLQTTTLYIFTVLSLQGDTHDNYFSIARCLVYSNIIIIITRMEL